MSVVDVHIMDVVLCPNRSAELLSEEVRFGGREEKRTKYRGFVDLWEVPSELYQRMSKAKLGARARPRKPGK